jgi:hypothetical protein
MRFERFAAVSCALVEIVIGEVVLRAGSDVDPLAWLAQTLERIANRWPISQVDELMPWDYKA